LSQTSMGHLLVKIGVIVTGYWLLGSGQVILLIIQA